MAALAQKHKELPRLACACDNLLLFRGQRDRWVPHDEFLTVEGARSYSTYQSINFSILSTLYELLSKQLISVLGRVGCAHVSTGGATCSRCFGISTLAMDMAVSPLLLRLCGYGGKYGLC